MLVVILLEWYPFMSLTDPNNAISCSSSIDSLSISRGSTRCGRLGML